MKKILRLAPLLLCVLLLSSCGDPRSSLSSQALLWPSDALMSQPVSDTAQVRLYFQYEDSGFLAAEERTLVFSHNESPEKAIVQALVDGPGAGSAFLRPLFPPGTKILSVSRSEDTLFITFSQEMLGRYEGEPGGIGNDEFILKRRLCTSSLVNTLTELNLCARVQILVQQDSSTVTSLRLPASFYRDTEDTAPLGPITRNESVILTPHNTARLILNSWITRNYQELYSYLSVTDINAAPLPDTQTAFAFFDRAPVLTAFNLSSGVVSPDGSAVILCADLFLQLHGQDVQVTAYPVRLVHQNGLWKIQFSQLQKLFEARP